ncbi:MAG: hypothetical protein LBU09_00025 [Endomicrobium sp.]|jgi:hypothetical protein|nr:hypothetical protein [Endomicrobium sp.]
MIDKTYSLIRYVGDGQTLQYAFDFDVVARFGDAQICVFFKDLTTLQVMLLYQGQDYALDFNAKQITLYYPFSDNYEIIIARNLPYLQDYNFTNLGAVTCLT